MTLVLPSNEECYRQLMNDADCAPRQLFALLEQFSRERDLLETGFQENLPSQFHELFWELYLPAAFDRFGFALKRGRALREPDFRFHCGDRTVFVEAVACGEPAKDENRVAPPSLSVDSDFEDGFAPDAAIMQRLAQAIDEKIKKLNRPEALTTMQQSGKYCVVIALNGNRAVNGHPHDDIPIAPPFVVRTVFGAIDAWHNQTAGTFWRQGARIRRGTATVPVAHFHSPTWSTKAGETWDVQHIAGILFSKATAWHTAAGRGDDFLFVQNPHGPDLTQLFSFCPRGVWVSEGETIKMIQP